MLSKVLAMLMLAGALNSPVAVQETDTGSVSDNTIEYAAASENTISENTAECVESIAPTDISELEYVRLSCYVANPGARCYDGTVAHEGVVACNVAHLGKVCVVYDINYNKIAEFECHDIGGNPLLMQGKAIDVYRDNIDRCWELVGKYGDHVYVKWQDEHTDQYDEMYKKFDHKSYADSYPDLITAFGYDKKNLFKHYLLYGEKEGRMLVASK